MAMYTERDYVEILIRLIDDYLTGHPEHRLASITVDRVMASSVSGGMLRVKGRHRDTECRGQVEVIVGFDKDLFPDVPLLMKQLEEAIARNLLGISE